MAVTLHTESRGIGGTPVLFVHSFAGDASHWAPALEGLKSKRRVVAFDLSGHGTSPGAVGRYSIGELTKDIGAVATTLDLDQFVLVGHSLGAFVAANYAGLHPQRVKALVLVDAPPAPGAVPAKQLAPFRTALHEDPYSAIEQYWSQEPLIDARAETRQRLLASLRNLSRNAAIELTEDLLVFDATAPLRHYPGPKFAIVTPRNNTPLSLHHAVPDFRYTVIAGTSHWIHLDKPDEFLRVLDGFISS
jgi:pimeloyl-ACP methyl ester carboxylesterase